VPRIAANGAWVDRHHLLPNAYTQGFLWGQATVEGSMAYLFGRLSTEGWWYYFPAAFLVKTPMMLLLAALAGLALAATRAVRRDWVNLAFLGLPVAVYLSGAMSTGINIGIRHILPIYPFVLLVAGLAFRALGQLPVRFGRPALVAVTAVAVLRFAQAYPNTISFFNAFVGGSSRGIDYLADSNLDWGQHLKLLKRWMDREDVKRINLAYFGTVDPAYYRIDYVNLPGSQSFVPESRPQLPGYVAISATIQTGIYGSVYAGFRNLSPVAVIGNTIRIYWVEQWPDPEPGAAPPLPDELLDWQDRIADGLLNDAGWPEQAVRQYQAYLERRPGDSAVRAKLGLALLQAGRLPDSMDAFLTAVNQDPAGAEMALALAEILWRRDDVEESLVLARRSVEIAPGNQKAREIVAMLTTTLGQKAKVP
jgi:tetratricopeptide (TPR) repeat protein